MQVYFVLRDVDQYVLVGLEDKYFEVDVYGVGNFVFNMNANSSSLN